MMVCTENELGRVDTLVDRSRVAEAEITVRNRMNNESRLRARHAHADSGSTEPVRRGKKSTTVDIGDCQHADSNQRQLMADAVLGCRRHGRNLAEDRCRL